MQRPMWAPEDVDITKPSIARVYDCLLGGFHNFEADRLAAEHLIQSVPLAPWMARMNRAFMGRAVKYCLDVGITQFLDLGSGLPSRGSVHEIAQQHNPETRILYVDRDPTAVTHCRLILKDNPNAAALYADLRQPRAVLESTECAELLDFTKPVCVLMVAVIPFIPDEEHPANIIAGYHRRLVSGSHLAISQPGYTPNTQRFAESYRQQKVAAHPTLRSKSEVEALLAGFDLVVPGVTWIEDWHPEPGTIIPEGTPTKWSYGVVARKP